MIFLSFLTLRNTPHLSTIGPTDLLHPSPAPHFKTFQVFLIYFPTSSFYGKKISMYDGLYNINMNAVSILYDGVHRLYHCFQHFQNAIRAYGTRANAI